MFNFFTKNSPSRQVSKKGDLVGCFGKMPIHADFIRHNIRSRESVELEKWIQEGVGFASRRFGSNDPEIPLHEFVWSGNDQDRTIAGVLMGSHDRSGRCYPFVLYNEIEDRVFRQMQASVPVAYDPFYRQAEVICTENWKSEPVSLLLSRVNALYRRSEISQRRDLLEQQIEMLREIPIEGYWRGLSNSGVSPCRETLIATLFKALRMVALRSPGRTPWGLRLPLPSGGNVRPFVVFWVQMIESILENRTLRTWYFWSRSPQGSAAHLIVYFRPPSPSYFLSLMKPDINDGSLFDLDSQSKADEGTLLSVDMRRFLQVDSASLLDVLYRLGRREVLQ